MSSDYHHKFHAGNVGDVLKHCALIAVVDAMSSRPRRLIDTHSGEGCAKLAATGEWTAGLGRLIEAPAEGLVGDYLARVREVGVWKARPLVYPGSPLLMLSMLGADESLCCYDLVDEVHAALARRLDGDGRAEARCADGFAALPGLLEGAGGETLVHIDPPYVEKLEWEQVSDAVIETARLAPDARQLLWYPIKRGRTRTSAMIHRVREAGVVCTVAELITTPLDSGARRLNGSGVLMVNPPAGAVARLCGALPTLGEACGEGGRWSSRVHSG